MAQNTKKYTLLFWRDQFKGGSPIVKVFEGHSGTQKPTAPSEIKPYRVQIEDLMFDFCENERIILGVVKKFSPDTPSLGVPGERTERPIDKKENERIIEKNHFLYSPSRQLWIYQKNDNGFGFNQFTRYLNTLATTPPASAVKHDMQLVLTKEAIRMLFRGDAVVTKFNFKIAGPKNVKTIKEEIRDNRWASRAVNLIDTDQEQELKISIGLTNPGRATLSEQIKNFARFIARTDGENQDVGGSVEIYNHDTKKLQLIDLITNKMTYELKARLDETNMPALNDMYRGLQDALSDKSEELNSIFGELK